MSRSAPPSRPPEDDYQAIEAAVMETARGRWFLAEFARRNRSADTSSILEAIAKLEEMTEPLEDAPDRNRLNGILKALADARRTAWQGVVDREGRPAHQRPQQAAESAVSAARRTTDKIREVAFELRETAKLEIYANALELYCSDLASAATLQESSVRRLADLAHLVATAEAGLRAVLGGEEQAAAPNAEQAPAATAVAAGGRASEPTAPRTIEAAPSIQPQRYSEPTAAASAPAQAESSAPAIMFVNPF